MNFNSQSFSNHEFDDLDLDFLDPLPFYEFPLFPNNPTIDQFSTNYMPYEYDDLSNNSGSFSTTNSTNNGSDFPPPANDATKTTNGNNEGYETYITDCNSTSLNKISFTTISHESDSTTNPPNTTIQVQNLLNRRKSVASNVSGFSSCQLMVI